MRFQLTTKQKLSIESNLVTAKGNTIRAETAVITDIRIPRYDTE